MTFLTDVIQVETTQSGNALELRFSRPVTADDRKAIMDAHNAALNTRPAAPVEGLERYGVKSGGISKRPDGIFCKVDQAEANNEALTAQVKELEEDVKREAKSSSQNAEDCLSEQIRAEKAEGLVKEYEDRFDKCVSNETFQEQDARRIREIEALETQLEALKDAAKSVEDWWLSEGMNHFPGAPYCIFAIRAALEVKP